MKAVKSKQTPEPKKSLIVQRGNMAAKAMAKDLLAEHKRWKLPLLSWQDGKVVSTKP